MFKKIDYHQAFFSGSEIWVLSFDPKNFWFKKINWHTQFLLQKMNSSLPLSNSLLVATETFFPNKAVLCIPSQKESWIKDIHKHWLNLKKPSLRIFLREKETLSHIEKDWPSKDFIYNLSYLKQYIGKNV